MRKLTILALTTLFVMATATFALACDGKADAATAAAKGACSSKADAATASAEGACSSKADAATASAEGACSSKADAATASANGACSSKADAATASAEGACSSKADAATASANGACCNKGASVETASAEGCKSGNANGAKSVKLETVRMPSGALAVFYNGTDEASVAHLQAAAEKGLDAFTCGVVKEMVADANCSAEMARTEHGVMILVHSKDANTLTKYEQQYASMNSVAAEHGE